MFMDSCAAGNHQLTKDSPSSKLLFYRDVQKYKKLVEKLVQKPNIKISIILNKFLLDIMMRFLLFRLYLLTILIVM